MSKLIIPLKPMLFVFFILAIVAMAQALHYSSIQEETVVWNGTCLYREWGKDDDSEILMKVKCEDGNTADVRNSDAFLSILYGKTNEFQCERQKSGKTSCVPAKNK